jgi:hypothetical protein
VLGLDKDKVNSDLQKSKFNRSKSIITMTKVKSSPKYSDNRSFNFKGFNLPDTMDYSKWGTIIFQSDLFAEVKKLTSKFSYHINILDKSLLVTLKYKDKIILEFTDEQIEKGKLNSFIRKIKNQEYIFIDGKLVLKKIKKQTKFIAEIISPSSISKNFLTMDLETRTINGVMTPYCVSIYDCMRSQPISFYLSDFNNANDLLKSSLVYLMRPKYHNYKIYIHNFSFFDAIFLLRIFSELTIFPIKPIMRDGRIIDLKLSFDFNNTKFSLFFRDSYLLLPSSLRKLAINFNVENKGNFPYAFVNDINIPLDYIGLVPNIKYFNNISLEEYNQYYNSFNDNWSLRIETIKYCEQDCKTLYQIIYNFQKKIFHLFRLDILKYPTLSSLAFAIFRSKFLKDAKIPIIEGDLFKDIKEGYTGGSVDVYKPFSEKGKKIYRYDVNSLYPYVMQSFKMPVGNPIYFEGDISLIGPGSGYNLINKLFGFFEVEIETPQNMKIPLLQTRLKTKNGDRTIAPLGTWRGTYFSEELFNALKYGYKFKILRGYLFEEANIFSEYVDYLYKLKVNSLKDSPDYIISKLLLNTLYGRFGMNPQMETHLIVASEETLKLNAVRVITNVVDLKNGNELVSFFDTHNWNDKTKKKTLNISVPIAAAVTASARIHMSKFKTMDKFNLFYSDTDSIDIDEPLDNIYIGSELGKMKLEHIFDEAIFLTPKVYGGINSSYEYVKVKGLKNPVSFSQLKPILIKDANLEIKQDKWYRNISEGNIKIIPEIYTLMINNQKRNLIYDNSNKFVDTSPIILNKGKIM